MPSPLEISDLLSRILYSAQPRWIADPGRRKRLTVKQAAILAHLDADEGVPVGELASRLGVSSPTVSATLDRLERLGYLTRTRGVPDARVVLVRLTEAGTELSGQASSVDPARVEALLERLTLIEQAEVVHGLKLLARAIDRTKGRGDG